MSYQLANRIWGAAFGWAVIMVIVVLGATVAVDSSGRQPHDHTGPVPPGVSQLSSTAYVIEEGAGPPSSICLGSTNGGPSVEVTTPIEALDAIYVECAREQEWEADGEGSPNFGNALVDVAQRPLVWIAGVVVALLLSIWPLITWRQVRARERRVSMDREQHRRELVKAWAANEIGDLDFYNGMDRLYQEGLEPAKEEQSGGPFR